MALQAHCRRQLSCSQDTISDEEPNYLVTLSNLTRRSPELLNKQHSARLPEGLRIHPLRLRIRPTRTRKQREGVLTRSVRVGGGRRLVREGGHEREPDQLTDLYRDLGPLPPAEDCDDRALWVAALINPVPALGVRHPPTSPLPAPYQPQGTSTLHTELAPGNPGCSQRCRVLRLTGV
eukprot:1176380-Prorocentrum_minimum.AAC.1